MPVIIGRTEEQVYKEHAPIDTPDSTTPKELPTEDTVTSAGNNQASHMDGTEKQQHPFPLLTFDDPAPTQESSLHPGADRPSTPPALKVPQPSIKEGPTFDPVELRQAIFPTELPPRPPPKRNFFARMFKRQEQVADDIELGSQGRPRASSYSRQLEKQHRAKNWYFMGMFVLVLGVVGLLWWVLITTKDKEQKDVQTN